MTSTIVSFPWAGREGAPDFVPTTGISGTILGVQSSRTTLVYTCPSAAQSQEDYDNGAVGALCPVANNTPQTVTYAPDFLGVPFTVTYGHQYEPARTTFDEEKMAYGQFACQITAAPVPSGTAGAASAAADPICTWDITSMAEELTPADIMPDLRCFEEDIVGPASNVFYQQWNTASLSSCFSSMSATPTTKATVTRHSTNVRYWTVTVTGAAAEVTLQPTNAKSAAVSCRWNVWTLSLIGLAMFLTL
ncbi:hypothetical protein MPH_02772 [Macrophomina phaseolina MS6]|uniref:Uncharacterized protein n=1 Tax=Macrophomina phaseolina (strain MS6) TaxID=1126212 RepID=K2SC24_MACPH|nr:hypothetical protein MPH_02772 [Macrophomina phaseolina MS6]